MNGIQSNNELISIASKYVDLENDQIDINDKNKLSELLVKIEKDDLHKLIRIGKTEKLINNNEAKQLNLSVGIFKMLPNMLQKKIIIKAMENI